MTGWKLREYKNPVYSVWERNPYYWCVDKWGNQLPFADRVIWTNIQDPQVMRVQIQQGKADYCDGSFIGLTLADVAGIRSSRSQNDLNILYRDSGSGTGSALYFNLDYHDEKYRDLFREPRFQQALSLAYDRDNARKVIYYDQGEPTTGTLSPKCIQFHVGPGPRIYERWRKSFLGPNLERARNMLDETGVVDKNGDGWRDFPDGSKLEISIDYHGGSQAGGSEYVRKDELLAKSWQQIGIKTNVNPIPTTGYDDSWAAGKIMTMSDQEIGDGPDYPLYPNWLVPVSNFEWPRCAGNGGRCATPTRSGSR